MKLLNLIFLIPVIGVLTNCTNSSSVKNDDPKDTIWYLGGFVRPADVNPIMKPDSTTTFFDPMSKKMVRWEENDTFNPGAVVKDDTVFMLYRAEDKFGIGIGFRTSRLGLAYSLDGINFTRFPEPVLFPDEDEQKKYEWPGGIEDPRVAVTDDGTFVVFYTQWNRDTPRLGVATSKNLREWQKHGPIFQHAKYSKFMTTPHKSASIVTEVKDNRLVVSKVNGKYFMYFGEHGVHGATSDNLIDWEPVLDSVGNPAKFIDVREGYFDSALTECGPPAVKTDKGILLIYNGKNHNETQFADKRLPTGTYSGGQVLFDKEDPSKVLERMDIPFMRPMEAFEKSGQYADGTVFLQGLVFYKSQWYMYYGCADSMVGVAVYNPKVQSSFDPMPISSE
ncbi:MAG: glycoside hydrolase family 130 protein [Sphingobacterium composti]|uniref:glycoside hydrolase family 130 protein n=1 Tax=Sphingobacterium composti TaxID=363260 RepID=UPI00135C228F|nr:glycoside hydrolase family 130 protein [Sphingobacterium composti Ten et al. 2007 non Yoo et al. 2007]